MTDNARRAWRPRHTDLPLVWEVGPQGREEVIRGASVSSRPMRNRCATRRALARLRTPLPDSPPQGGKGDRAAITSLGIEEDACATDRLRRTGAGDGHSREKGQGGGTSRGGKLSFGTRRLRGGEPDNADR